MPVRRLLLLLTLLLLAGTGPPAAAAAPLPAPASGAWPLEPRPAVARRFDPPQVRWGAGHRGVDLVGRAGQPVRAALGGRVRFAGRIAGRGVVTVDHGGVRTTYEPVAAVVRVGEAVDRGAMIGRLERAGSHCLPRACLHWGLIAGRETYLDPLRLVGLAPVRLLPLGRAAPAPVGPPVRPRTGSVSGPVARRVAAPLPWFAGPVGVGVRAVRTALGDLGRS